MKVARLELTDYRCFRGKRVVDFCDALTEAPRPMTVIVGSNGSGKTTILATIYALIEAMQTGVQGLGVSEETAPRIAVFTDTPIKAASDGFTLGSVRLCLADALPGPAAGLLAGGSNDALHEVADAVFRFTRTAVGGVIFFPHVRDRLPREGGPISPVVVPHEWTFKYEPSERWNGSLEQLWLWQNYLDLEAGREGRENLGKFVEGVEDVLGSNRRIIIREGRVLVPPGWAAEAHVQEWVRIDQLPSGERQLLLLFGELARRLRRGAVLMIDEPEISLHPVMQRLLVDKLRRLAKTWDLQVILATHSSEIVHAVFPSEVINLDLLGTPTRGEAEVEAGGAKA